MPRWKLWHAGVMLLAAAPVLAATTARLRGGAESGTACLPMVCFLTALVLGLWLPRRMQGIGIGMFALLPLSALLALHAATAAAQATGLTWSYRMHGEPSLRLALVLWRIAAVLGMGVSFAIPAWPAVLVSALIRGIEQRPSRRIGPIRAALTLIVSWAAAYTWFVIDPLDVL